MRCPLSTPRSAREETSEAHCGSGGRALGNDRPDGLSLTHYKGSNLSVGGELNKLAANIALGRNTAGVHWRSDGIEGLKLGEAVAAGILTDLRATYTEQFAGFTLTGFDGKSITA